MVGRQDGVDDAYRECEAITRAQARNFAYGIRLLPPPKRRALSAIYAAARRVDDIGDRRGPAGARRAELELVRRQFDRLDQAGDAVQVALRDTAARMPVPMDAFHDLIDGCLADVEGRRYETARELIWYCRCVAGSVGRLSLGVFGDDGHPATHAMADALGVALQLTNILRDLREDRLNGRIYLPAQDLERFRCRLEIAEDGFDDPPDRLAALIRFEVARASQWYAHGLQLLRHVDRRSAACTSAMAGIYHRLLRRIADDPLEATRRRIALPATQKAWVAGRALAGLPPHRR